MNIFKVGAGFFGAMSSAVVSVIAHNNGETADYSSINELNECVLSVQAMPSNKERRAFLLLAKDSLSDDTLTKKESDKLNNNYRELSKKRRVRLSFFV